MATITIEITDSELKCMEFAAVDPVIWITNMVEERSRKAGDEIISLLVEHCNNNEIALAVGRDAQITQAYELNVVDTAFNREAALASAEATSDSE